MHGRTHTVVLGGSLAGLLAAAAAARSTDRVTLVESDDPPTGPDPRKGVPQARHTHLLWSGGARVIESLLPGVTQRWLDAGARRIGIPDGLVSLSARGWMRRWPQMQFLLTCSRDLLDWVVRERVLEIGNVTLRQGVRAEELLGDGTRVTGARLRERATGDVRDCPADLVVDATGRGSRATAWLASLGLPPVPEETVDSGLTYATRVFRAPDGIPADFPVVNVQADPHAGCPGQTATLLPVEGGRWLVTLSGTRGGEPTTDPERFVPFARAVRHPVVGDLIAGAEPLGPVRGSRSTVNRRRFFERLPRWPEGFVVTGDAVATYNPVYGHGMSVAAWGAAALRNGLANGLARQGHAAGTAYGIQRAIARTVDGAWATATTQDVLYPEARGDQPGFSGRLMGHYVNRLMAASGSRPAAAEALFRAFTLSGPMTALAGPKAVFATLLGPYGQVSDRPPFNETELRAIAGG
ncbi:NAD(P)/FAD-dependent oxidoreductase [Streptomyces oceani]|uniref:Pyridine nucleotide-disulfide oxidoreductase n=1 Tax=Streptomyces oceani TaxID=1075402 RepID=A0A1E7KKD2_9ACTN|nr:FAD-dependent oxidoreductase [Streptomyces oceani]OEV04344.1 pyridine nucleotide-disulfide oxidoreductase [Streptomyces oceani]